MLCGYRFGRLALGSPERRPVSPEETRRRADSMYLPGLLVWDASTPDGRAPVDVILSRDESRQLHALGEAVLWAWSFGLGVALVGADLDAAEWAICRLPRGRLADHLASGLLPVGAQDKAGPSGADSGTDSPCIGRDGAVTR
jgi:hypothetical protein